MANAPGNPSGATNRTVDAVTRERLQEVLREELMLACQEALANGMSPDELTSQLDHRIARLRAQVASLRQ